MMRRIGIHFYNSKPLKKFLSTSKFPLNEKNKYPETKDSSKHFEKFNSNKNEFVPRHETNRQYTPRSRPLEMESEEQLTPSFFMENKKIKYSKKVTRRGKAFAYLLQKSLVIHYHNISGKAFIQTKRYKRFSSNVLLEFLL